MIVLDLGCNFQVLEFVSSLFSGHRSPAVESAFRMARRRDKEWLDTGAFMVDIGGGYILEGGKLIIICHFLQE